FVAWWSYLRPAGGDAMPSALSPRVRLRIGIVGCYLSASCLGIANFECALGGEVGRAVALSPAANYHDKNRRGRMSRPVMSAAGVPWKAARSDAARDFAGRSERTRRRD